MKLIKNPQLCKKPAITFYTMANKYGMIRLNRTSTNLFKNKKFKYINLFYNKEKGVVGFKKGNINDSSSCKVCLYNKIENLSSIQCSLFFKEMNLFNKKIKLAIQWDEQEKMFVSSPILNE
jgi:hypothetical protein